MPYRTVTYSVILRITIVYVHGHGQRLLIYYRRDLRKCVKRCSVRVSLYLNTKLRIFGAFYWHIPITFKLTEGYIAFLIVCIYLMVTPSMIAFSELYWVVISSGVPATMITGELKGSPFTV